MRKTSLVTRANFQQLTSIGTRGRCGNLPTSSLESGTRTQVERERKDDPDRGFDAHQIVTTFRDAIGSIRTWEP